MDLIILAAIRVPAANAIVILLHNLHNMHSAKHARLRRQSTGLIVSAPVAETAPEVSRLRHKPCRCSMRTPAECESTSTVHARLQGSRHLLNDARRLLPDLSPTCSRRYVSSKPKHLRKCPDATAQHLASNTTHQSTKSVPTPQ